MPIHDEIELFSTIVFEGCVAPTPLHYVDDGTRTPPYYVGQQPAWCQNVVTDEFGNIIFFIVDNNIYNRHGVSFVNNQKYSLLYNQSGLYYEHHYWLHQEKYGDIISGQDYCGEYLNRSCFTGSTCLSTAYNRRYLGPELIIVPVPNSINEFYLIYSVDIIKGSGVDHHHIFYYRTLTFIDDENITMTPPTELSNEIYCDNNVRHHAAITEYRDDEGDYLLFINNESGLKSIFVAQLCVVSNFESFP